MILEYKDVNIYQGEHEVLHGVNFRVEEGWFELWLGRNANERITGGRVYVQ